MPTIAIISQKGGSGKTTLAVHLASAAEKSGQKAVVLDTDMQATATQWAEWRDNTPPDVLNIMPSMISKVIPDLYDQGAEYIVIDTPPHANEAAVSAIKAADLVLVPCRPTGFDLASIETTAKLIALHNKPAHVVFTCGNPNAPKLFAEAQAAISGLGLDVAPCQISDRAAFRHSTAMGQTALEYEPKGKAAEEVMIVYKHTIMLSGQHERSAA